MFLYRFCSLKLNSVFPKINDYVYLEKNDATDNSQQHTTIIKKYTDVLTKFDNIHLSFDGIGNFEINEKNGVLTIRMNDGNYFYHSYSNEMKMNLIYAMGSSYTHAINELNSNTQPSSPPEKQIDDKTLLLKHSMNISAKYNLQPRDLDFSDCKTELKLEHSKRTWLDKFFRKPYREVYNIGGDINIEHKSSNNTKLTLVVGNKASFFSKNITIIGNEILSNSQPKPKKYEGSFNIS